MEIIFIVILIAITFLFAITIAANLYRLIILKNATFGQIALILIFGYIKILSDFVWSKTINLPISPTFAFSFGNFSGVFALYLFSNFISKDWFPSKIKIFHRLLNGIVFLVLLGFAIDIIRPEPTQFLYLINDDSSQRFTGDFYFIFILYIFFLILTLYFYNVFMYIRTFPSSIFSENSKKIYGTVFLLIILGVFFSLTVLFSLSLKWSIIYIPLIILSHLLITTAVLFVFFLHSNPIMVIKSKANLDRMIKTGIVGWGLFGFVDDGPMAFIVSQPLLEKHGITDDEILALSVSLMTVSGLNQSFNEVTFSVPFPANNEEMKTDQKKELMILCTSFFHIDPTLKDKRMQGKILAVYTLFIPNYLIIQMSNFNKITPLVLDAVKQTETIQQMSNVNVLDKLSIEILKQLL